MSVRYQLGIGILLGLLLVTYVQSNRIVSAAALLQEFGTYNANDRICFYKQFLKSSSSPVLVSFSNPTLKAINYIRVEQVQQNIGGIAAEIIRGAIGTSTVTVQISTINGKSHFVSDVRIQMMCTA
ncbi:uncharacterized protein LOC131436105 [Malaya genurostris]|uniref:uncharacterized protein LOC131436105 n=1 Tax=Malaya genurostris TaxID=325434 RepID=UPI0026F3F816|nr:uncharacterized protein LOC131436105 [Malaya genurostris]